MSSIGNGFAFCKTAQLSRLKVGFSGHKLHNGAKSSVKWHVCTSISKVWILREVNSEKCNSE